MSYIFKVVDVLGDHSVMKNYVNYEIQGSNPPYLKQTKTKVVDVQKTTLILEITGDDEKIDAFAKLLSPYGILETIRTGLIGLERGDHTIYQQCEERDYYGKDVLWTRCKLWAYAR